MSIDPDLVIEITPPGRGAALDLGGGTGLLREALSRLGYRYVNLDAGPGENGQPSLVGDAHRLPFRSGSLDLVVSKDTLEHFVEPRAAVGEVLRVLKPGAPFVIWVPFMHPFHSTDYYRYTPLGLRHLLGEFEIERFESPLWVFTVVGNALVEALRHARLGFLERPLMATLRALDRRLMRGRREPAAFAAGYRLVARKPRG